MFQGYKKTTCAVCGNEFLPHAENTYIVETPRPARSFTFTPERFDAIDCPMCGCQSKLAARLPKVETNIPENTDGSKIPNSSEMENKSVAEAYLHEIKFVPGQRVFIKGHSEEPREDNRESGLEGKSVFCPCCGCEVETSYLVFASKEGANVFALEHCDCAGAKLWRELLHK